MALFFYTQFQVEPSEKKDEKPKIIPVTDCFDPDLIGRGRFFPDGSAVIILKDGHEEERDQDYVTKNGVKGTKAVRVFLQSEIRLMPQDATRLRKFTELLTDEEFDVRENTNLQTPGIQQPLQGTSQPSLIVTPEEAQAEEN